MSDVHKLTEHLLPGEVEPALVEALEELLEQAKRGELTALAWASVRTNNYISNGWEGAGGTLFPLGAAVMCLQTRYANLMIESD